MTNIGKAKIEKTFGGLSIVIPFYKDFLILLFLIVLMAVSLFFLFLFYPFRIDRDNIALALLVLPIFFGTGLYSIVALFWIVFGKEKFIVAKNQTLFEKTALWIGSKNRLKTSAVNNFRLVGDKEIGSEYGKIKFDYGLKTYCFGSALNDAEANHLVGLLKEYFKDVVNIQNLKAKTNNGKAKIEKTLDVLSIAIPSAKNSILLIHIFGVFLGFFIVFGGLWLVLFSFNTKNVGSNWFFLDLVLLIWALRFLQPTIELFWACFGQEKFIVDTNQILFQKTIFGIGKKNRFEISAVKNLRADFIYEDKKKDEDEDEDKIVFWKEEVGKIKFDVGSKTYSFGRSVDDAEANYIVEILTAYLKEVG
jgi:hypothetical protein